MAECFGLDWMLAESRGNCMICYLNNFICRAIGIQQAKAIIGKEVAVTHISWNWGCYCCGLYSILTFLCVSTQLCGDLVFFLLYPD